MKTIVKGKNIDITEEIINEIESHLVKLDKYFTNKELEVNILLKSYSVFKKIEITINFDKDHTLRQEVTGDTVDEIINKAIKKIERQIRKFKSRLIDHNKDKNLMDLFLEQKSEVKQVNYQVTKRKILEDKLMTEEEAVLQFELIGHDFYIFNDVRTETTKVLYKRKDKEYGIIEIEN